MRILQLMALAGIGGLACRNCSTDENPGDANAVGGNPFHAPAPQPADQAMNIVAGRSSSPRTHWMNSAATAPSITR